MNHDLTVPLTVPVSAGEEFLLDHLRCDGLLSPQEQQEVVRVIERQLSLLLEQLPVGTPQALVDQICDLPRIAETLLGISTSQG